MQFNAEIRTYGYGTTFLHLSINLGDLIDRHILCQQLQISLYLFYRTMHLLKWTIYNTGKISILKIHADQISVLMYISLDYEEIAVGSSTLRVIFKPTRPLT